MGNVQGKIARIERYHVKLEKAVVSVGETQDERERLARLEEKVDTILKKIDEKTFNEKALEERVRVLEVRVGILMTVGAGAWAVILILMAQVFGKIWG